jgi:hypothetical protein
LALAFELTLNIDIARNYYMEYMGDYNRRSDVVKRYDASNWRYLLGLPPDFLVNDETQEQVVDNNFRRKRTFRSKTLGS